MGTGYFWTTGFSRWAGPLGYFFFALLVFYQALFFALFGLLFAVLKGRWGRSTALLSSPLLWTASEFLASLGPLGIPELIGHGQLRNPLLRAGAPLLGVNYLTFLAVTLSSLLTLLILEWRTSRGRLILLFPVLLSLLFGNHLLNRYQESARLQDRAPAVSVAIIQVPVDPRELNDKAKFSDVFGAYEEETKRVLGSTSPDLILLPEDIFPYAINREGPTRTRFLENFREFQGEVLIGGSTLESDGIYYNAALLFREGDVQAEYQKEKLFPIGEYIPLSSTVAFLKGHLPEKLRKTNYRQGIKTASLLSRKGRLGISICFESLDTDLIRRRVTDGADILINLTNDSWFAGSTADEEHFFVGAMRALENGRHFIQVASYGISGTVDPLGKTLQRTGPLDNRTLLVTVPLLRTKTWFTRLGLWRFPVFFGITGLFVFMGRFKSGGQASRWKEAP